MSHESKRREEHGLGRTVFETPNRAMLAEHAFGGQTGSGQVDQFDIRRRPTWPPMWRMGIRARKRRPEAYGCVRSIDDCMLNPLSVGADGTNPSEDGRAFTQTKGVHSFYGSLPPLIHRLLIIYIAILSSSRGSITLLRYQNTGFSSVFQGIFFEPENEDFWSSTFIATY
ncbi:hypothetical protein PT974_09417 [Cladobotryum mycophilum]|uniref:Uncharacterized protein n=1 Tax=Cladobotryum mycophilum TaxID=491253 RepID=A0ABR0SG43_9HYPO